MRAPISLEWAGMLVKHLALRAEVAEATAARAIGAEQEERRQRIALEGRVALLHAENENLRENLASWQRAHAELLQDWMQCESKRLDVAEHVRPDSMPWPQRSTQ